MPDHDPKSQEPDLTSPDRNRKTAYIIIHPIQFWPEDVFWCVRLDDALCVRKPTNEDGHVLVNPTDAQKKEAIEHYIRRADEQEYDSVYVMEVIESRSRPYLLNERSSSRSPAAESKAV